MTPYDTWKTQTPEQGNGTDGKKYQFTVSLNDEFETIAECEDDAIEEAKARLLKMLNKFDTRRGDWIVTQSEIEPDDFTGNDD